MTLKPNVRRALAVEALEDRTCLSVSAMLLDGQVLYIQGSRAAETVWITQNDDTDQLTVAWMPTVTGPHELGLPVQMREFRSSGVRRVVVNLRGGDDTLTYTLQGESGLRNGKDISVDLGSGNDQALFDLAGEVMAAQPEHPGHGDGGDPPGHPAPGLDAGGLPVPFPVPHGLFARFRIVVAAGEGDDLLDVQLGSLGAGVVASVAAQMGAGSDVASATLHGAVRQGASLTVGLAGGTHADTLGVYSGDETAVDLGGNFNVLLDGQTGADVVEQHFDGELNGRLNAALEGGVGDDLVTQLVRASWDSAGSATLRARGSAGADRLTLLSHVAAPPAEVQFIVPWTPNVAFDQAIHGGTGRDQADTIEGMRTVSVEVVSFGGSEWLFGPR